MAESLLPRCGRCDKYFDPPHRTLNVFRIKWDDPGTPLCPDCFGILASRNIIVKDETKLLCRCDSQDPAYAGKPCPAHTKVM